jgi:hypothetical protein
MHRESTEAVTLTGKVIRTWEKQNVLTATVVLDPCRIDIASGIPPEIHLGEQVRINALLVIEGVSLALSQPNGTKES